MTMAIWGMNAKEEALLVVDDFTARARDLQEGTPGIPADDVDYVAAKVRSGQAAPGR